MDDGKSTLIGRLLFDTKKVLADQMAHVEEVSERRGDGYVNLALLTDGLRAEREQGITIDVAYRYFQTAKRKFIIADTPGHEQYTRNMVTGASTADLSLKLIDARAGVVEQSKRHAYIAALLRIPHLVVCVNKMDLVDWDEEVFDRIVADFTAFAAPLELEEVTFIPISALSGDNVVERSENMPWYTGPLAARPPGAGRRRQRSRFRRRPLPGPVGHPPPSLRATRTTAATPVAWPAACSPRATRWWCSPRGRAPASPPSTADGDEIECAFGPLSCTLRLEDDVDVSRGDMICPADAEAEVVRELTADVCWMASAPDARGRPLRDQAHQPNGARGDRGDRPPDRRAHPRAPARRRARP